MPLSASAQAFLKAMASLPQPPDVGVPAFRDQLARLLPPQPGEPEPVAAVVDREIPGGDGQPLAIRIYRPDVPGPAPAAVWLHGGSFVRGTLDTFDAARRSFANLSGFVVVAVDQRLAPETRFPGPLHDAHAAWLWTVDHAAELGVDPSAVGVAGESSGGNLAAATALLAARAGDGAPAFQVLLVPVLDATCALPSVTAFGANHLLTAAQMGWMYEQYAPGVDRRTPLLSPLHAAELHGLAPAVVVTVEYDPARDEGEQYGRRLADAGVPVELARIDGMVHHFPGPDAVPLLARLSRRLVARILTTEVAR
jgi:acetyl esterase